MDNAIRLVLAVVSGVISHLSGTLSSEPIAAHSDKFIGNIVHGEIPSNFLEYWNQVTPENSGKWGNVEPIRDRMDWSGLDNAYNFAKENDLPFKQHNFIWGNQAPGWLDSLSLQEQREEVEEWIRLYGERYPETDFIDVVNEPLHTPVFFMDALGGTGETGFDWIVTSCELARTCCPDAKLLVNEYYVINYASNAKRYLELINVLKERGLCDGIGIQSHFFSLQWLDTIPPPSLEDLKASLDLLASAGLPLYISELDIYGDDPEQLHQYKRNFPLLWEHPAVAGITLWGWVENHTWAANCYLYTEDGVERPALQWLRAYVNGEERILTDTPYGIAAAEHRSFSIRQATDGLLLLHVDRTQAVSMRIMDLHGRMVISLPEAVLGTGIHCIPLDGNVVSSGNYFVTVDGRNERADFNVTIMK